MKGNTLQSIQGLSPADFENLFFENYRKVIELSDCIVKGILTLDAQLNLNSNKLIIDNPSPLALIYKSHFIKSESQPNDGLGEIQWNIADSTGTYNIPFGSGNDTINDLNLSLTTLSPGSAEGNIVFATFPTGTQNMPLPDGVSGFLPSKPGLIVDRYWKIKPEYIVKPSVDIEFSYTKDDISLLSNADIIQDSLAAFRYNNDIFEWTDWKPFSISSPGSNKVLAEDIDGENFYSSWLLQQLENQLYCYVPNAFTPDGDGLNDYFGPVFSAPPKTFKMYILDRWKFEIFSTEDIFKLWDGTNYNNIPQRPGVYIWLLIATDEYGNEYTDNGYVTLLK